MQDTEGHCCVLSLWRYIKKWVFRGVVDVCGSPTHSESGHKGWRVRVVVCRLKQNGGLVAEVFCCFTSSLTDGPSRDHL